MVGGAEGNKEDECSLFRWKGVVAMFVTQKIDKGSDVIEGRTPAGSFEPLENDGSAGGFDAGSGHQIGSHLWSRLSLPFHPRGLF